MISTGLLLPRRLLSTSRCRTSIFQQPTPTWRGNSSSYEIPRISHGRFLSTSSDKDAGGEASGVESALPETSLGSSWDVSVLATQAADHTSHNLSWYNPNGHIMDFINLTHDSLGISYACSIATVTFGMRLFLILPLGIYIVRRDPIFERDMDAVGEKIERSQTAEERRKLGVEVEALKKRQKRKKYETIASAAANIAILLTMWSSVRYMVVFYPEELSTGGILWFQDLTQSDIYLALPAMGTLGFFLMGELGSDSMGRPVREYGWKGTLFWRTLRLSFFFILVYSPAALFCYWVPHTSFGILQSIVLSMPKVQAFLGIAPTETAQERKPVVQYYDKDPTAKATKQAGSKGKNRKGRKRRPQ